MDSAELGYSYWNWNRALAYGIKFDETMMYDHAEGNRRKRFDKVAFYACDNNCLYDWPILKLHGSMNWFQYIHASPHPKISKNKLKKLYTQQKTKILLWESHWNLHWHPWLNNMYIDPTIITPTLHKEKQFMIPLYKRILNPLWDKAEESLKKCKELVIIGYSFPPTDFHTKKMFLEAFSQNTLEKLIVVNPSCSDAQKAADLCHFNNPTRFNTLQDYMTLLDTVN